jgi:glucose/mannose-6-phosphate isomerase
LGITSIRKRINEVDKSDLKSDYEEWPDLAARSWQETEIHEARMNYESIAFVGMGGSGIVGQLVSDYAEEMSLGLPVYVMNAYRVPRTINDRSLIVGVSLSGNTSETLSFLSEAHLKGLSAYTFGSGGLLEEMSGEWGFKFTRTKMLKVARSSFPSIFFAVLKFLSANKILSVKEEDVLESIESLKAVKALSSLEEVDANYPLRMASRLASSKAPVLPLIYSSSRTRAIGIRVRQSLNENAKMHAFTGIIPETFHNDIVGWDAKSMLQRETRAFVDPKPFAILLRLDDDPSEIALRFQILERIIKGSGIEANCVPGKGRSYLSRVLSMLYGLECFTYYSAILRGVNPIKTPSIDLYKRSLHAKTIPDATIAKQA